MTTDKINQALNEFELFNTFIPLKEEVLQNSLLDSKQHVGNNVYYLDNVEEIKRYYVNEICDVEYTGSAFGENSNDKILRARIESLLNTLYLGTVSVYIIDILTEFIYNGFQENNNQ